jgi:hypothetical protein
MAQDVDNDRPDTPPTTNLSSRHDPQSPNKYTGTNTHIKTFKNDKEILKTPFQQQHVIGAPYAHSAIVWPTSNMGKSHLKQAIHNTNALNNAPTHPPAPAAPCLTAKRSNDQLHTPLQSFSLNTVTTTTTTATAQYQHCDQHSNIQPQISSTNANATTPPRNLLTSKSGQTKNSSPTSVTHYPEKPLKTSLATAVTPTRENHLYSPSISFQPSTCHNTTPIVASSTNTPHYTPRGNLFLSKVATLTQWLTQPQQKIQEHRKQITKGYPLHPSCGLLPTA